MLTLKSLTLNPQPSTLKTKTLKPRFRVSCRWRFRVQTRGGQGFSSSVESSLEGMGKRTKLLKSLGPNPQPGPKP